jgi:5'-3' exonuclease
MNVNCSGITKAIESLQIRNLMANTPPIILIDGDIHLYTTTSGAEVETDWGDDLWTLHSDFKECKEWLSDRVESLKKRLDSPNIIFCLSDDTNFRKGVLPTYKSHRKSVRKPLAYQALKHWAMSEYPIALWPTLEADDVMGIIASSIQHPKSTKHYIVASEDKDLKTIPCTLFRQGELKTYSVHEADYWFYYQTLVGDVTDGYKGCPGVGEKGAEKILKAALDEGTPWANTEQMNELFWTAVVNAYEKAGLTEADALVQARCARILRATDWSHETQKVKLWEAPKITLTQENY